MARLCGYAALFVFVLSAAVHAATFLPGLRVAMSLTWPLHLAAMAVFAMMVVALVARQSRQPKPSAKGLFAKWGAAQRENRAFQTRLLSGIPRPLRLACGVMFAYAILNFVVFIVLMEGGGPEKLENGTFSLQSHGTKIRDITEQEYHHFRAYEVRGFSGHWMLFSFIPVVYFLAAGPRLAASSKDSLEKEGGNAAASNSRQ